MQLGQADAASPKSLAFQSVSEDGNFKNDKQEVDDVNMRMLQLFQVACLAARIQCFTTKDRNSLHRSTLTKDDDLRKTLGSKKCV